MDRILRLDMVPPTIAKRIQAQNGSFQLWLDGGKQLKDFDEEAVPRTEAWFRQLSRMKVFDNLISNWDRSPKNIMVDDEWNVVLIDHSQAFLSHKRLDEDPDKLPVKFDRDMVKKLEGLVCEVHHVARVQVNVVGGGGKDHIGYRPGGQPNLDGSA